jgi:threonylcarbamoyladenosine tRNA methylthiotransferase MtaB
VPKAAFITLGCKVNQYETQRILDDFEARGFDIEPFNASADVYVINSCSVTQPAERKSRYMLRKVARQNPDAVVVLTGCYGEMAQIKGEVVDEAHLIVPNHRKMETLAHVLRAYPELEPDPDTKTSAPPTSRQGRRRATLKVQDGCDVFCAFCSIPYTRKVMASRAIEDLVAETEMRVRQGYQEIVVTGVLVGAYGQELPVNTDASGRLPMGDWHTGRAYTRPDLADLLLRLAQVEGITRVRLSSIEPTQVTDRLLNAFATETRLCRHLHIPLQSGDSGVLRAMNRPYDRDLYLERCRTASERIPDLAITTDIMVGFPGEDRAAFENTLDVVRKVGFARAHLFRYSPRPNTPAAQFANQISDAVKDERSAELLAVSREMQREFIRRYLGRTLEVLVEGRDTEAEMDAGASGNDDHASVESHCERKPDRLLSGYTSNYIRVQFTGSSRLTGRLVPIRLSEPVDDGALGDFVDAHFGPDEAPPDADFIPLATLAGRL